MASAAFTGPGGGDPVSAIRKLTLAVRPTEGDVLYGMARQATRILQRTGSGVNATNTQFQPYSPAYAKYKAKFGRSSSVDLRGRDAPHMLQALQITAGAMKSDASQPATSAVGDRPCTQASLVFYDERAAKLAKIHNEGLGHQPQRKFFDVTPADLQAITQDIGKRTDARLQALPK